MYTSLINTVTIAYLQVIIMNNRDSSCRSIKERDGYLQEYVATFTLLSGRYERYSPSFEV